MLRRNALSAWALALVGLLSADRALGYSYFQVSGQTVIWSGAQSVRYLSPASFPEDSEPQLNLLIGMGLWNLVPACDFQYFYDPEGIDYLDHYDGYNDTIAADLDPGVLAVTYMVNSGRYWFDMDQAYSPSPGGVGWTFATEPTCDVVANPAPANGYSLVLVATHELGHALGLGHDPLGTEPAGTAWFIATMNPRYPGGGTLGQLNIVETHTDDRNGARFLYPHSGPSEPPYVDLAAASFSSGPVIGKAVPLSFAPSPVYPGGVLTVRSVIENLGTTNEFYVRQGFYLSADSTIETTDLYLGHLLWDIAFADAFEFDVDVDMPADLAAGSYYVGSVFDDLDEVAEEYEDNNAAACCAPLSVGQLVPVIEPLGQYQAECGQPWTGPAPTVTHPLNMGPLTWSLLNPEPGMSVDPATGVISWPSPVRSSFLYTLYLRAANSAGSDTEIVFLGVDGIPPQITALADDEVQCLSVYTGPAPTVTSPACMEPIINWSLDAGPPGMIIDHSTGIVQWFDPLPAAQPYTVTVRATNAVGNGTVTWHLTVLTGDLNFDGVVSLADLPWFEACVYGPEEPAGFGCECADSDADGDVDLLDFAALQRSFGQ